MRKQVNAISEEKKLGKTPYFNVYQTDDGLVKMVDLNGNYTEMDKDELSEPISLLQKCYKGLK